MIALMEPVHCLQRHKWTHRMSVGSDMFVDIGAPWCGMPGTYEVTNELIG